MDKILIPISRFRRELNKWMRFIENNPEEVLFLTRNKIKDGVITSPEWYEKVRKEIEEGILNAC